MNMGLFPRRGLAARNQEAKRKPAPQIRRQQPPQLRRKVIQRPVQPQPQKSQSHWDLMMRGGDILDAAGDDLNRALFDS